MSHIIRRYAPLLTKYDVRMLFSWLRGAYGSIAEAARVTGVQRKTVYDWETLTEDIRLETKLKVLEQNMRISESRTMEFLIRKTDNDLKEALQHYLRCIYENSMKTDSKEELSKLLTLFKNIRKNYRGAIFDNQPNEIEEMSKNLTMQAKKFHIDLAEEPIDLIRPEIIADRILTLLQIIETNKFKVEEIKQRVNLPSAFVDSICRRLNYFEPGQSMDRPYKETLRELGIVSKDDLIPRECFSLKVPCVELHKQLNAVQVAKE